MQNFTRASLKIYRKTKKDCTGVPGAVFYRIYFIILRFFLEICHKLLYIKSKKNFSADLKEETLWVNS